MTSRMSSSVGNMPGCGSKSGCKSGLEPCSPSSSSSATVSASKYGATYCSATFRGGTRIARSTHTSQFSLANSPSKKNWLVWVDLATLVPPWKVPEQYVAPYFEADTVADDEE